MWAPIFIQHAQSVQRFCKPGSPKWPNFGARSARWPKQFIKSSLGHPASVIPRKPQWMLTKIAILQIKSTARSWEHDSIVDRYVTCLYLSALFVCAIRPWTGSTLEKRVGCWQFCEIFSGSPEAPLKLHKICPKWHAKRRSGCLPRRCVLRPLVVEAALKRVGGRRFAVDVSHQVGKVSTTLFAHRGWKVQGSTLWGTIWKCKNPHFWLRQLSFRKLRVLRFLGG